MRTQQAAGVFFLFFMSFNLYACGGDSKELEYSFFGLLFTMMFCAILLPVSGMLSAKYILITKAVVLSIVSVVGMFVSLIIFIAGETLVNLIVVTAIFSVSLFFPTACYFYYSLTRNKSDDDFHCEELLS